MYERWAEVIGGMLDVARVPGFLENLEDFYDAADVEGDAVRWFIENWRMRHGATPVKVSDVADWALEPGSLVLTLLPTTSDRGLRTAFSLVGAQHQGPRLRDRGHEGTRGGGSDVEEECYVNVAGRVDGRGGEATRDSLSRWREAPLATIATFPPSL